jgi:hypothetical protein
MRIFKCCSAPVLRQPGLFTLATGQTGHPFRNRSGSNADAHPARGLG